MTASQRSRKWTLKMQRQKRCAVCGDPPARSCQNKFCDKFRQHTRQESCPKCEHKTVAHRLCSTHMKQDRERKTAAR